MRTEPPMTPGPPRVRRTAFIPRISTPVGAWTHLAATYDGTTLRLYANDVQPATRVITGSMLASSSVLRTGGNGSWNDEWFAGLIDEVRQYSRALSVAEIQADMVKPVNGG